MKTQMAGLPPPEFLIGRSSMRPILSRFLDGVWVSPSTLRASTWTLLHLGLFPPRTLQGMPPWQQMFKSVCLLISTGNSTITYLPFSTHITAFSKEKSLLLRLFSCPLPSSHPGLWAWSPPHPSAPRPWGDYRKSANQLLNFQGLF